ncbi:MAG: Na+/H+ antiporter NhaC family protein [Myxococcota bacterium]
MPETQTATWLSLLPALVTIGLAFATRRVIPALFAGILAGSAVIFVTTWSFAEANPISNFVLPALGTKSFARILIIYLWCLGGLIGMWEKTGGALHFANWVVQSIRGPRSALFFTWVMGLVFHQGGTVSTVLVGSTVKPVADRHRISHEELAYVVDSTASPVATLLAFNAWPLYVAGIVAGTIPILATEQLAEAFFWSALPYNFYAMLALLATLLFSLGWLPWCGRALSLARERARSGQGLDRPGAEIMRIPAAPGRDQPSAYTPSLLDFALPIVALLSVAVIPIVFFDQNRIDEAFVGALLTSMLVARLRGMSLTDILDGFLHGCQQMTVGAVVLALAITLGTVSKELGTASFVVGALADGIPAVVLPAALTLLCMGIAFATGTSWGTYAVVFPLALPLAYALNPDPTYVQVCFAAVLGGAVFGDQCSPISDTTILSSMFTGCDLMDHVRTQFPIALAAASLGAILSTLAVMS